MATEKQLIANRANAQKSTGPRTETGKAVSARNSATHNLTARYLVVPAGHELELTDLEAGLRAALEPSGTLQEVLFKRIVESAWKLERCRIAEESLFLNSRGDSVDPLLIANSTRYPLIQKYARDAENSFNKAFDRLAKLQTEAKFRQDGPQDVASEACNTIQLIRIRKFPRPEFAAPPVFQNEPNLPQLY